MDYFLLKQSGTVSIPKEPEADKKSDLRQTLLQSPSVRTMDDLSALNKFDYIVSEHLVSSPLKEILEQYLPEQSWRACVFINPARKAQKTFWFLPPLSYVPKQVQFASNGMPSSVLVDESDFGVKSPGIFYIRNPKGTYFYVIHLSVAESILRRGICGLELLCLPAD